MVKLLFASDFLANQLGDGVDPIKSEFEEAWSWSFLRAKIYLWALHLTPYYHYYRTKGRSELHFICFRKRNTKEDQTLLCHEMSLFSPVFQVYLSHVRRQQFKLVNDPLFEFMENPFGL